jgi:predicted nucleic acid-binding Zn ribbon protein
MDCPKCGTWNPDDKRVCWRCQTEMPKPVEKKKRKPVFILGLPLWTWVVLILMLISLFVFQSFGPSLISGR